jgi:large subunit ribosomal protein L30
MPRTFVWHPKRGPKKAPQFALPEKGKVRIKQIRSGIGNTWRMRATLRAIGLKHHQDVVVQEVTPGLRGQISQVRHLIEVTPVEKTAKAESKAEAKAKGSK